MQEKRWETRDGNPPSVSGRNFLVTLESFRDFVLGGHENKKGKRLGDHFEPLEPFVKNIEDSPELHAVLDPEGIDPRDRDELYSFLTNPRTKNPYTVVSLFIDQLMRHTKDPRVMFEVGLRAGMFMPDLRGLARILGSEGGIIDNSVVLRDRFNNFWSPAVMQKEKNARKVEEDYGDCPTRLVDTDYTQGVYGTGRRVLFGRKGRGEAVIVPTHSPFTIRSVVEMINNHCGGNLVYSEKDEKIFIDDKQVAVRIDPTLFISQGLVRIPKGVSTKDLESLVLEGLKPELGVNYMPWRIENGTEDVPELCIADYDFNSRRVLRRDQFYNTWRSTFQMYWPELSHTQRFFSGIGSLAFRLRFLFETQSAGERTIEEAVAGKKAAALKAYAALTQAAQEEARRLKAETDYYKQRDRESLILRLFADIAHDTKRAAARASEGTNTSMRAVIDSTVTNLGLFVSKVATLEYSEAFQTGMFSILNYSSDCSDLERLADFLFNEREKLLQGEVRDDSLLFVLEDSSAMLKRMSTYHQAITAACSEAVEKSLEIMSGFTTIVVEKRNVNLDSLLDSLCKEIEVVFPDQEIVYSSQGECVIPIAEREFVPAIRNFIDNAREANRGVGGKRINVDLSYDSSGAYVRVDDEGPGAPEEVISHIKEGEQVRSTKLTGYAVKGSGIGLRETHYRIVTLHDGRLDYSNKKEGPGFVASAFIPFEQVTKYIGE